MSKAYPSNLTQAQYDFLSDLIPDAKPGARQGQFNVVVRNISLNALSLQFEAICLAL